MPHATLPTDEGRRRYAATGGYYADLSAEALTGDPDHPCTCEPTCAPRCGGACGCPACALDFTVYCDIAGLFSVDGLRVSEDEALAAYRGHGVG